MTEAVRPAALEPLPEVYTAMGACTHLDVSRTDIDTALAGFGDVLRG